MAKEKDKESTEELRKKLISAGRKAVAELIKVAEADVLKPAKRKSKSKSSEESEDIEIPLSSDKLKNAAAAKKMAIFDGFEILAKVDAEELAMQAAKGNNQTNLNKKTGLAEQHSS